MTRNVALGAISLYQVAVSPYLTGLCRHSPTCSNYAYEAIVRHGLGRGAWYAMKRLMRCRPMGTRGFDPVP